MKGQLYAAEHWYGLMPVTWGWIAAVLLALAALYAWVGPLPSATAPRGERTPDVDGPAARWLLAAVIASSVAIHLPGLLGSFNQFDDQRQIHWDKTITRFTAENVRTTLLGDYKGTNQELMYFSFQLNWLIAEGNYWVWYLFNLVGFVGILLLFHRFARHVLGHRVGAGLAVALFATAPIVSELLCWISVRSHLIGLFWVLVSLVAWFEWRDRDGPAARRLPWLVLSVVGFGLSQMSKPIFLYLPGWLVLFDLWQRRADWRRAALDKLPYVVVAAFFLRKILAGGASHGRITDKPLGGSYYHTVLTDLNFVVEYLRSLFAPYETGLLPHKNVAIDWLTVKGTPQILTVGFAPAASLVILLAVAAIAGALAWRRRWSLPLLVLVAGGGTLLTVLNIPWRGNAAAFEYRYTVSAHLLVAILLADTALRLARSAAWERAGGRVLILGAVTGYLAVSSVASVDQTVAWRTSKSFWTRNAALYPLDYHSNYYAAKALQHTREHFAALQHLQVCLRDRFDNEVYRRLADSYYEVGLKELATDNYLRYYSRKPSAIDEKKRKRFAELGITNEHLRYARRLPIEDDPSIVFEQVAEKQKARDGDTDAPLNDEPAEDPDGDAGDGD